MTMMLVKLLVKCLDLRKDYGTTEYEMECAVVMAY
jgi:hypothetical protein